MARGYPDFFGYSTFPYYGAVQVKSEYTGVTVANGDSYDFCSVAFKGKSLGGWIVIESTDWTPYSIKINPIIDGVALTEIWLYNYRSMYLYEQFNPILKMVWYKPITTCYFGFGVANEFNWGATFAVRIANGTGADIDVYAEFYWSKVI